MKAVMIEAVKPKIFKYEFKNKVVNNKAVVTDDVSGQALETPDGQTLQTPGGVDLEAS